MVAPKLSMTGGRRRKEVDGCDEDVDFDAFCEGTQNLLCPMKVLEGEKQQDHDTLDFVFEHVESIICIEGAIEVEGDDPHPIKIVNVFIDNEEYSEPDSDMIPRIVETFEASSEDDPSVALSEAPEIPAPVVQLGTTYHEKDMLDYVFEKVESLVCQEDAPDDHYMGKYGTAADMMAADNSLIAVPSYVNEKQARQLDKLERERIADDDTVVDVLHADDGVEIEDKTFTKKKKANKKPWYKKLACVAGKF